MQNTQSPPADRTIYPRWCCAMLLLLCLLPVLTPLAGCSCTKDPSQLTEEERKKKLEELAKKKKKEKPNFSPEEIELQPGDRDRATQLRTRWLKPGHWVSARQEIVANNFNFVGDLDAAVVESKTGQPIQLSNTAFRLTTTRPVALSKGQKKHLDMMLFVPENESGTTTRVTTTLRGKRFGEEVVNSPGFFTAMAPYQYYFVVLARNPDAYRNVANLESIRATWFQQNSEIAPAHYRLVFPRMVRPAQVPQSSLCWTSVAYLLWDDFDPELLTYEQQQAIVDWLHWGGQLIVSGPESLDTLRASFLKNYLPATSDTAGKRLAGDLAGLSDRWTPIPLEGSVVPLRVTVPWTALELTPRSGAQFVPGSEKLLVEGRVGRGRIVLSAVRLYGRDLTTWSGWDNFFNACILRRPPRVFAKTQYAFEDRFLVDWAESQHSRFDSGLISNLRYFSRDAGRQQHEVASWSTVNPVPDAARAELRQAAGIEVPKAQFVVWTVALYLVVLVPLNWAFFAAIGRVEWAWIAAPVVAILCSVLVVRLAQLDIGFARAQTEIAVLEAQAGYRRAHVTRYTALYTSLSSTYDLHYESFDSVALPFPKETNFRMSFGQEPELVTYDRGSDVTLSGIRVSSNTTEMVHSEQMLDLGGVIELAKDSDGKLVVRNGSSYDLAETRVLTNPAKLDDENQQRLAGCWIGSLPAGDSTRIPFSSVNPEAPFAELSRRTTDEGDSPQDIGQLDELARDDIRPGEIRLVARIDKLLAGMRVEPASSQIRATTLVIVHLLPGEVRDPKPDTNGPGKAKKLTTADKQEQLDAEEAERRLQIKKFGRPIPDAY